MNWLDIMLLVTIGMGSLVGLMTGLVRAVFSALGLVLGVYLAARFSGGLADVFTSSISSETLATAIVYVIIFLIVILLVWVLSAIVIKVLNLLFMGWLDKLGGLILGFAAGIVLAAALIVGMARYAYNFELPREGDGGQVAVKLEKLEVRKGVERALMSSKIAPIFLDARGGLSSVLPDFLPRDFDVALDILDKAIEEGGDVS